MEQDDDHQLSSLLKEWRAPATPTSLEEHVLAGHQSWWHFLVRGYIRVPVPVVCCLAVLMAAGVWRSARLAEKAESCAAVIRSAAHSVAATARVKSHGIGCPMNSQC